MRAFVNLIIATILTLSALSCDTSDDVNEIFTGHRFKISGITYNGIKTVKEVGEFYANEHIYWLSFDANTIHGVLQAGTVVEGTWKAEGKNRKISINLTSPQSAEGMSELCNFVFNTLRNATSYSGDRNVMRIYKSGDTYIDLSSYNI